ncbi:MAG: hypothetical protein CL484_09335 [Acidobacteria bacterium]|nr:hypothetical protein [Acidobacteriota bacterium]|tara:strand:- start:743 stop:1279 length:537 start_codon:yes stop_codon:yes gene_type:complete
MVNQNRSLSPLDDFLRVSIHQLRTRVRRIEVCLDQLTDDQVWARRHEVENAVGNLVIHLCGNIRQWIVGGIGGQSVNRDRDAEFAQREPLSAFELTSRLRSVAREAEVVLERLTVADLPKLRRIQGYEVTVLHAVYHVVEHLAEHCGQVIWATKGLTGRDLGFYRYLEDGRQEPGQLP